MRRLGREIKIKVGYGRAAKHAGRCFVQRQNSERARPIAVPAPPPPNPPAASFGEIPPQKRLFPGSSFPMSAPGPTANFRSLAQG